FDLIVLEIMMPAIDGLEVTKRLHAGGIWVPVLFLTARDGVKDKITGLTVGGDDYLVKPFSLGEVVARARAILRRSNEAPEGDGRMRFADVILDEDTHEVWRGHRPTKLTTTEFIPLRVFTLNPRRLLSMTQILDDVWHYDFGGDA